MRRVEVLKVSWPVVGGARKRTVEVLYEADFHSFGYEAIEGDDGILVPSSIAIVEKDDGQVETVTADLIKFKDKP